MAWLERGAKPDEFPTTQRDVDLYAGTLVIEPDGRLLKYERGPYPMNFLDTQTAIGSGGDFARAAMACGRTAAQAVEMAALFDSGTGNGIDTLALE